MNKVVNSLKNLLDSTKQAVLCFLGRHNWSNWYDRPRKNGKGMLDTVREHYCMSCRKTEIMGE